MVCILLQIALIFYKFYYLPDVPLIETDWKIEDLVVEWFAPFYSTSGYGDEAIFFVLGLQRLMPGRLHITQFGDVFNEARENEMAPNLAETLLKMEENVIPTKSAVSVCHSLPHNWYPYVLSVNTETEHLENQQKFRSIFSHHRASEEPVPSQNQKSEQAKVQCPSPRALLSIGRTMSETDRIPPEWVKSCNNMDQIWVPTQFHKESFERSGVHADVVVIPEPVDTEYFDPAKYSPAEGIKESPEQFLFLSIFKWEERKGWKVLIEAFLQEFSNVNDDVLLYIATHPHEKNDPRSELDAFVKSLIESGKINPGNGTWPDGRKRTLPKIVVNTAFLSPEMIPRLYRAADVFVLSTHGEGWGRPITEAMSMQLPTIATYWSGPTAYLTQENSFPLEIEKDLVEVKFEDKNLINPSVLKWANPSFPHLKYLMRYAYEHPEECKKRGLLAREKMFNYRPLDVAKLIQKTIFTKLSLLRRVINVGYRYFVNTSAVPKSSRLLEKQKNKEHS